MLGSANIPAATAVLGYDLFQNETWQTSGRNRILTGIACTGSTAINDFGFDLFIEDVKIGSFINTRAGVAAPLTDQDVKPLGRKFVPAGAKISAIVTNAAVGNPVLLDVYGQKI